MRLKTLKRIETVVAVLTVIFLGLVSFYGVLAAAIVWDWYAPGTGNGVVVLAVMAFSIYGCRCGLTWWRRSKERAKGDN